MTPPDLSTQTSTERFSLIMGINEAPYLGEGWMEREVSSNGPTYRATHPTASLHLPAGRTAKVAILLSAPPAQPERPFTGQFIVNLSEHEATSLITPFTLHFPHWSLREFELPETENPWSLTISVDRFWRPADIFHNNDGRTMGVLVSSLSMTYRLCE